MQDINLLEHQSIAWTPTPEIIERAQLTKFMRQVGVSTWEELYEFSIRDVEKFTEEVIKFLNIKFDPPYEKLLDTSNGPEFPSWLSRSADSGRNADALVRNEGEARTTADTKGWHSRGILPHFDGQATQFVTFRLADSLPQSVLSQLQIELERSKLPDPSREYRKRVEEYLDKGVGECILRKREIAEIVKDAILKENGRSCQVIAWVIMPNHVHLLIRVLDGFSLSVVLKAIKSASSHRINKTLGRKGPIWQPDHFDRFIRDAEHYEKTFRYIHNNPVKAGLCTSAGDWEFSSASLQAAIADEGVRVPTAGLNITTMCLDRWQTDEMKDQPAVIAETEGGDVWEYSYETLFESVTECARALRILGLGKGDAIGIHLPMIVETVVALLAINSIGGIAVPVFSGYGVEAIASRMNAVGAKAIFTSDGFFRRGKFVKAGETAVEAVKAVPTIERLISVRTDLTIATKLNDIDTRLDFEPFLATGHNDLLKYPETRQSEPTSAEDPLIILYTSGTTGKPKGIAHTHASFPIKAAQDMAFGCDVGRGTRICWYTDLGWMMGPWLIYGALINCATICLYDGAPDYPTADRMWEFCAKHKVEVLGISPTLVRSLAAHEESAATERVSSPHVSKGSSECIETSASTEDLPQSRKDAKKKPHERHDLSSLRAFGSTGEPWNPGPWWWLFNEVGNGKVPIINYSGGTEISGGILMGNPLLPIKPCSFPAPCPGMDVDILDENGDPVGPNQVGELVIKQPWIGMARGFWQERERYLETYWNRFPGIWVHGDWAMRDDDGHWFILGRSDDTLKVAGKRVGPAEVESILVSHPSVTEAAVIGVPDEVKGTSMVAFCVLAGGKESFPQKRKDAKENVAEPRPAGSVPADDYELEAELKALVARDMGKPLAPSFIHVISALPKTRNAKVMRRVIRSAYLGEDAGDLSSLENPDAVDEIAKLGKAPRPSRNGPA